MRLSPEEEAAFASIASRLSSPAEFLVSWVGVAVSVVLVGVAVVAAALLGLPGQLVAYFCGTFAVALTAGLLLVARWNHRHR